MNKHNQALNKVHICREEKPKHTDTHIPMEGEIMQCHRYFQFTEKTWLTSAIEKLQINMFYQTPNYLENIYFIF